MTETIFHRNAIVQPEPAHEDDRGVFQVLANYGSISLSWFTIRKGKTRAQHFHKASSHFCRVETGLILYKERPVGSSESVVETRMSPGDVFFTPPDVEHAMVALEDSSLICFSDNPRDQEAYEADLVRLQNPL